MMNVEIIGLIAGSCTTFCTVPQLMKTLKEHDTRSISLLYFSILLIGLILWFVYGFAIHNDVIIISNMISFGICFIIFAYKMKNVILHNEAI